MSPHCDFSEQRQSDDKKPDLLVHLPGQRVIIIDAKVPDLDFLQALDAADPLLRAQALNNHAGKLKRRSKTFPKRIIPGNFPMLWIRRAVPTRRIAFQRRAGGRPRLDLLGRATANHARHAIVVDFVIARRQR